MDFIEILKDIMDEYDVNQTQLAELLGLRQSQISEWAKGKSKPAYDNIRLICTRLDIDPERILGLD